MNKEKIITEFQHTFDRLVDVIRSFDNQSFNKVPFEGSWTAGQVAQHLKLANGGFTSVLNGDVEKTTRAVDAHIASLKEIFLNFNTKMESPDFILPEKKDYSQHEFIETFERISKDISEAIRTLDLSETCLGFQFPGIGHLTRLEAVYFVIYHTQRHTNQLEKFSKTFNLS